MWGEFMKKAMAIGFAVFLSIFLYFFLTQSSLMYTDQGLEAGDLHFYSHRLFKTCFAGDYAWPSGEKSAVMEIPDVCDGYRVTALGGYIGSGGPCPLLINLPDTYYAASESMLPGNAQIEQYHLVINIGKYLREDTFVALDEYHNVGENRFIQILVTVHCSPENPYFYSEDGKLYRKSDDSLVEGFFYDFDYSDSESTQ